ncbi:MAG TPA: MFS transporter [Pyrinomonadaceae bacterium]|nr:MFS transporter [Pyrinomonadaceae bacterium]
MNRLNNKIEGKLSSALHALKHRNFKIFLSAQLISLIGNYIQTVAAAWLVYRLTGSATLLGLIAFSGQISVFVLAPVSGVVADTKSRRNILFVTQIAPMILTFILGVLALTGRVQVWHVFAIALLLGVINAFDFPVRQAFVAELVSKEDLMSAVTLNSSMINSARTIGPGIGGLLVATVGEGWCFLGNALSFVAVIIGLMMMTPESLPQRPVTHFRAGIAEAFNFARRTGPVGGLLVLLGLISFMGLRYEILMPVYVREMLHGGPTEFGLLMGASGIGAVLGSIMLAAFGNVRTLGDWVAFAAAGFGVSLVLLSISHSFALSLGVMLLIGFSMVSLLDASNTLVQRIVPDELRGRIMAIWTMMLTGLAPFGSLLVGFLAQHFTSRRTFAAGGMACVMGAMAFGFSLPILQREARKLIARRSHEDGTLVVARENDKNVNG